MPKTTRYAMTEREDSRRSILFVAKRLDKKPEIDMNISDDLLSDKDIGGFLSMIIDACRKYAKDNGVVIYVAPIEESET